MGGVFELAIIEMGRCFDLSQNAVLFMNCMLPMEAFIHNKNDTEMKHVHQVFDFAKSIAEMGLSQRELALYSAYTLSQEDRGILRDISNLHMEAVARFWSDTNILPSEFPGLYLEVFG